MKSVFLKNYWANYVKYGSGTPKEVIAKQVGKSRATVYNWSTGRKDLKLNQVFALCQALNVDFLAMIGVADLTSHQTTLEDLRPLVAPTMTEADFGKVKLSGLEVMVKVNYTDLEAFKEAVKEAVNA